MLIYTYGYSAAAAGAAFLPFSGIMAVGLTHGRRPCVAHRRPGDAGGRQLGDGPQLRAVRVVRREAEYWLGFLPRLVLAGIGMTAYVAPLTTVVLDAAPSDLGGSASGVNNAAARLGGLVAVAALGFPFSGTSASDIASVAVVGAYRRVMWTAAALALRPR